MRRLQLRWWCSAPLALLPVPVRCASSDERAGKGPATNSPSVVSATHQQQGDASVPSVEVHNEQTGRQDEEGAAEEFDAVEAAAQEIFNVLGGMYEYVMQAEPYATPFFKVKSMQFREGLYHRFATAGRLDRRVGYRDPARLAEASALYEECGNKLMTLLTQEVFDRITTSASKYTTDMTKAKGKRKLKSVSLWREFDAGWYRSAPYELQLARPDAPMEQVLNARYTRDRRSLRLLAELMHRPHPFRLEIEKRLWQLTKADEY